MNEEQLICMAAQRELIKQIMGFYQGLSSSSWVLYSCIFFFCIDKDIDEREHCLPDEDCIFFPAPFGGSSLVNQLLYDLIK